MSKKLNTPSIIGKILVFVIEYIIFYIPNVLLFILSFYCLGGILMLSQLTNSGLIFLAYYILPWIFSIGGIMTLSFVNIYCLIPYCLALSLTYSYFESKNGGTFIRKLIGLKVCNLDDSLLSFRQAFKRNFIKFFFFACCPFLLLPFWGSGTQGLHDKICGTKVVYRYGAKLKWF